MRPSLLAALICANAQPLQLGTGWGFDQTEDLRALHSLAWFYNWGTSVRPELAHAAQVSTPPGSTGP